MEKTTLPPAGSLLRLAQIIGDKKRGIPAMIPVGRTTFLNGVRSGRFPQPVKLTERATLWRLEDVQKLIEAAK